MTRPEILDQILDLVDQSVKDGLQVRAFFDLDSTLMNVKPRLKRIISEFARMETTLAKYPMASKILQKIESISESYHLREHLKHFGLDTQPETLHHELHQFWKDRFFHSEYLLEDTPNEGAVEYVNHLYDRGADIIYLTGRDTPRMGEGSVQSLKKWNFPIGVPRSELVTKPHHEMDDAEFKRDYLAALPKKHLPIWFFENEPHNIVLVLRDCPHVKIVYFDSVHSGKSDPPGPDQVPWIRHFKRS